MLLFDSPPVQNLFLRVSEPPPTRVERAAVKSLYGSLVDSASPGASSSFGYASLRSEYRERAEIDSGDPRARAHDLTIADNWVDMTLAIKKQKAEKADLQEKRKSKSDQQSETTVDFTTAPNPQ